MDGDDYLKLKGCLFISIHEKDQGRKKNYLPAVADTNTVPVLLYTVITVFTPLFGLLFKWWKAVRVKALLFEFLNIGLSCNSVQVISSNSYFYV